MTQRLRWLVFDSGAVPARRGAIFLNRIERREEARPSVFCTYESPQAFLVGLVTFSTSAALRRRAAVVSIRSPSRMFHAGTTRIGHRALLMYLYCITRPMVRLKIQIGRFRHGCSTHHRLGSASRERLRAPQSAFVKCFLTVQYISMLTGCCFVGAIKNASYVSRGIHPIHTRYGIPKKSAHHLSVSLQGHAHKGKTFFLTHAFRSRVSIPLSTPAVLLS